MAKPDTSGKTVTENVAENGGEIEGLRPYQRMTRQMLFIAENESSDNGFEIAANVIDKMLEGQTIDDILSAGSSGPKKGEDMLHKPFVVASLQLFKSAEKFKSGSLGVYYTVTFRDPIKFTEDVFSIGAPNVVAALWAMDQKNVFDGDDSPTLVIRSKETGNGNMLYLERA
jgi:hypothetical protein